jgi:hypothetical protein
MVKYLLVLTIAGLVIYAAQHPEFLGVLDQGPDFKVWVDQIHVPPNNTPYDILNVQSREQKPIIVKRVLMNDNPKCVNMEASTAKAEAPVNLGDVLRITLGIHGLNACSPVKVLISTNRSESVYNFD